MTIFYNLESLNDTLIINLENNLVKNIENKQDYVLLKDDKNLLVGINILNASQHFCNLKNGYLYPTKELLEKIENLTGFTLNDFVKKSFVVAKILEAKQIPNAHLHECIVDVGLEKPLQIVCGAKNARANINVVCALVGTIMPNGTKILPGKLMNIDSCGMLCSAKELGLDLRVDGILELADNLEIGVTFKPVFKNL